MAFPDVGMASFSEVGDISAGMSAADENVNSSFL